MPERLGIGLQNRGRRFESARYLKESRQLAALTIFILGYIRDVIFVVRMQKEIQEITQQEYKYGFTTDVETEIISSGLNEDVIRLISAKKNEPEWLLDFRL